MSGLAGAGLGVVETVATGDDKAGGGVVTGGGWSAGGGTVCWFGDHPNGGGAEGEAGDVQAVCVGSVFGVMVWFA